MATRTGGTSPYLTMWLPFGVVSAFAAWRFWLAAFVLKTDRLDNAIDRVSVVTNMGWAWLLQALRLRSARMKTIGRMLTWMILIRFIFILFGISIFVLTLDAVTYANEILQLRGNDPAAIGYYMLLRAPGILSTFLPISVLLSLLLTLTELSYRNETVALWSAGVSPLRMMGLLLPLALVIGALYFLINDRAVPSVAPTLREWGIGDYGEKRLKIGERDPIWMRAGSDILRAASANAQVDRARRRDHLPPRCQWAVARTGLRQERGPHRRPLADVGCHHLLSRESEAGEARLSRLFRAR